MLTINTTLLISLISLTFLSIITPGPSNILMMSSSALFGWRKTIPLYLGINFGSGVLVTAAVYGLGAIIDSRPWLVLVAKLFGAIWLSYMSLQFFKNAKKKGSQNNIEKSEAIRPFRFYEGILMQWANPKAIMVAIAIAAAFIDVSETPLKSLIVILTIFVFVGMPTASTWLFLGNILNKLMSNEKYVKKFNFIMGFSILLTAFVILMA
ncbi:MAG: LysE family translocator [Pseudomonadota bacterium]|nr:LysE family translocator [Pseudomonadota bacterium]